MPPYYRPPMGTHRTLSRSLDADPWGSSPSDREEYERFLYGKLRGGDMSGFDPVPDYLRRWFTQGGEAGGVSSLAAMGVGQQSNQDRMASEYQGYGIGDPFGPEMSEEDLETRAEIDRQRLMSPEVLARIAEVLGNSQIWQPPPGWLEGMEEDIAPAMPAPPAPTPPPAAMWSGDTPFARDADAFAAMRRTPGLGAAVPSEERSLSDRLRPPYVTPIPGANPANAGMAAILERAFGGLPPAAQGAFRQGGVPLDVGRLPAGAFPGGALESGAWPRTAWAGNEEEMRQQLLRELMERGR